MGLVKTRRLAAMHKQQRAIRLRQGFHLRQGYGGRVGGLKAGMKPPKISVPGKRVRQHGLDWRQSGKQA